MAHCRKGNEPFSICGSGSWLHGQINCFGGFVLVNSVATKLVVAAFASVFSFTVARPSPLSVTVAPSQLPPTTGFSMGESRRPDGVGLTLDSGSLRLGGKPWTPVMGEFHYARYPENEWREELLKMKAGGIDIVATYVFWIHHEEIEDQFDWSRRRSLRHFIELCRDIGLKALVRCGPWDHGEVRNGGFPDWLEQKGWQTRSNDANYLAKTRILYCEIAKQLAGLLWKDGGPVIGIQVENEYWGPAEHLMSLKRLAREAGLDVPLYTKTGWPRMSTALPFGEIVPLYGVYAEGFWDRELAPMPDGYWRGFHFSRLRTDEAIGSDILGNGEPKDPPDADRYPYLTCEIGGGMMNSYHRRILVYPADVETTTLVKLGSGSNLPGYYMYHGGVNPDGKLTTLQESQATGFWNDMPVKCYDFQAPLGEYGQIRPQYPLLRRLHLFLHDWGAALAAMPPALPDQRPTGRDDLNTLRWCVRSDGHAGFVFVNNYQRLQPMPARKDVQFAIRLPVGKLTFPGDPVTVPSGSRFLWPFNLELGAGFHMSWATAQPVCAVDDGAARTVFFAQTEGIPAEFAFDSESGLNVFSGEIVRQRGRAVIRHVQPGRSVALLIALPSKRKVQIVLLNNADSLALWKGDWQGGERVFLTGAGLLLDGDNLRLTSPNRAGLTVGVYPAPVSVAAHHRATDGGIYRSPKDAEASSALNNHPLKSQFDGIFRRFIPRPPPLVAAKVEFEQIRQAGPPRVIPLGKIKDAVAAAPGDADFAQAAVWRIKLPRGLDLSADIILRLHYVGDVARVTLNGKLLTDDFYNGNPFDVGLRRHAPEILRGDLHVAILPLRKDAPIYMAKEARPDFGSANSLVELQRAELVPVYEAHLRLP